MNPAESDASYSEAIGQATRPTVTAGDTIVNSLDGLPCGVNVTISHATLKKKQLYKVSLGVLEGRNAHAVEISRCRAPRRRFRLSGCHGSGTASSANPDADRCTDSKYLFRTPE